MLSHLYELFNTYNIESTEHPFIGKIQNIYFIEIPKFRETFIINGTLIQNIKSLICITIFQDNYFFPILPNLQEFENINLENLTICKGKLLIKDILEYYLYDNIEGDGSLDSLD